MPKSSNIKYPISNIRNPKVAIVHDWLYGGGAELVVEQLHLMYPEAPIYTSYCTPEWRARLDGKIITGYLQHWPFSALRKFLPVLRQHWFRGLDLSQFDIVISSSGNGEAKFVLPKKDKKKRRASTTNYQISDMQRASDAPSNIHEQDTKRPIHVCYCHTPTHFYWRKYEEYLKSPSFKPKWLARLGLRLLVKPLRKRDYQAAQSVDYFIANSSHIQNDIKKYYDRDSVVIHPPVNVSAFTNPKQQAPNNKKGAPSNIKYQISNIDKPRFILWGRHVPYKRFDLAIEACNTLQLPLTVVGSGPETENLKKIAGPTITFAGRVSDAELITLAHSADAFLFPGEEDFGIAPVEALAAGLPVIAYKSGGALDYVIEGKTGIFFEEQTQASLIRALQKFQQINFRSKDIADAAEQFSSIKFKDHLRDVIINII